MPVRPAIIPCLRYADAPAAIDFLCRAFGFERHAVYANADDPNRIDHAQLVRSDQMIMLGSIGTEGEYESAAPMTTVAKAGGSTMGVYVVLDDVDAHAAQAGAEGADIFMPPKDQDYGGRGYSARDCEGNVWSFGSYDPWAAGSH